MKNLFSNLKEKNTFIFFLVIFGIFAIAFDPTRTIDTKVLASFDKVKHLLAFLIITYLFIESSIKLNTWLKVFLLIFIAFFIEYIQSLVGRSSNILDFIASVSGVVLFFCIRFFVLKNISK